jgi:hypothetical protein
MIKFLYEVILRLINNVYLMHLILLSHYFVDFV